MKVSNVCLFIFCGSMLSLGQVGNKSNCIRDSHALKELYNIGHKIENDSIYTVVKELINTLSDINAMRLEETALFIVCNKNKKYHFELRAYRDSSLLYPDRIKYYRDEAEKLRAKIKTSEYIDQQNNTISDTFNLRRLQLVELLLCKNADPNIYGGALKGPLIYHVENEVIFDLLVENGADINAPYPFYHPFGVVSTFERVNKYIDLGFDFSAIHGSSNEFREAFLNGLDVKTFKLLAQNNSKSIEENDEIGWSFIHYVAAAIRPDLLKAIIEINSDLSLKTTSENQGYYGYDKGIPAGSTAKDIVDFLYEEYRFVLSNEEIKSLIKALDK